MQQKNINYGAKLTGKIAGGIYLIAARGFTFLPADDSWVPIGTGDPTHPLFQLMPVQPVSAPSNFGINDYFELRNPAGPTSTQSLWYRYGKRSTLYCSYSLTIDNGELTGILFQSRITSFNPSTGIFTAYPQSVRSVFINNGEIGTVEHVFPIVAPSEDTFYIELRRNGLVPAVITVRNASLALGE